MVTLEDGVASSHGQQVQQVSRSEPSQRLAKAKAEAEATVAASVANATVKPNSDTCQMRQAVVKLKVSEAEKNLKTEGVRYIELVNQRAKYLRQTSNGEAARHGQVQAKLAFPAKFHRLEYDNAQRRLGRSPAKEMCAKIKTKVQKGKKQIEELTAQYDDVNAQLAKETGVSQVLTADNLVVLNNIKRAEEHLRVETAAHKLKFDLELKKLGNSNARRAAAVAAAAKARNAAIAKEQTLLREQVDAGTTKLRLITPQAATATERAVGMSERLVSAKAGSKKSLAKLHQELKNAANDVTKELTEKTRNKAASKKERGMKRHLEREKKRIGSTVKNGRSELLEKNTRKKMEIHMSRAMMSMKAKNAALRDEIVHINRQSALRVAEVNFNRVKEKSAAANMGMKNMVDLIRKHDAKQVASVKTYVDKMAKNVDRKDPSNELQAKIRTIKTDMKTARTPEDYYQRDTLEKKMVEGDEAQAGRNSTDTVEQKADTVEQKTDSPEKTAEKAEEAADQAEAAEKVEQVVEQKEEKEDAKEEAAAAANPAP